MISIKNPKEIQIMREGGKILAEIIEQLKSQVRPGITTQALDKLAENLILKHGKPSFKNYKGFPNTLCTSINSQIVHGMPSKKELTDGDILSLDLGIEYKGFHTDMALTIPVGEVDPEVLRLIRTTKKALKRGIKKVHPGNTFGDLGNTIQRCIESQGFVVIKNLCGHGIGRELHEEPNVLNYGKRKTGSQIKEGMVFCIEPMASISSSEMKEGADGYALETKDGSFSAHFEHTVAVTERGCIVLTEL